MFCFVLACGVVLLFGVACGSVWLLCLVVVRCVLSCCVLFVVRGVVVCVV